MLQCGYVEGNLLHVIDRYTRDLFELEEEQLVEGRLRPLDLRGEQGLFANIGVEKQTGVGKQRGDAVEPTESDEGLLEEALLVTSQLHIGLGRQGLGYKGPNLLPPCYHAFATARKVPLHAVIQELKEVK